MELLFLGSILLITLVSLVLIIKFFQNKHFYPLVIFIPIFLFWAVSSYFTVSSMAGWPVDIEIQEEFILHKHLIIGKKIYLWITEKGSDKPRSYVVPYKERLHRKLDKLKVAMEKGMRVKGKMNKGKRYQKEYEDTLTFKIQSPHDILKK